MPVNGELDLNATTQQGEVANDYGDGVVSESQGRSAKRRGAQPKGPAIALNTGRREVSVRKLE